MFPFLIDINKIMAEYIKKLEPGGQVSTEPTNTSIQTHQTSKPSFKFGNKDIDLDQYKYSLMQNYRKYINQNPDQLSNKQITALNDQYSTFINELDNGNITGIDFDGSVKMKDINQSKMDFTQNGSGQNMAWFAGEVANIEANNTKDKPTKSFTNTTLSERLNSDIFGGSSSKDMRSWFDRDVVVKDKRETKNRTQALLNFINSINLDDYTDASDDLGGIQGVRTRLQNLKNKLSDGVLNNDDYSVASSLGLNLRGLLSDKPDIKFNDDGSIGSVEADQAETSTQQPAQQQVSQSGAIVEQSVPVGAIRDADGKLYTKKTHSPIYVDSESGTMYAKDASGTPRYYDPNTQGWTSFQSGVTLKTPQQSYNQAVSNKKPTTVITNGIVHKLEYDREGTPFYRKPDGSAYYQSTDNSKYWKRNYDKEKRFAEQDEQKKLSIAGNKVISGQGSQEWSAPDKERLAGIVADIGGVAASFSLGYGTIGAGIAGLASTALNTVADFTDDSVSSGEAWKNVGTNLGMTMVGLIPGEKAFTILTKAIRFIPRLLIMANVGKLAIDSDVHQSLLKALKWSTDGGNTQLTVNDWKNIGFAFNTALGASAGIHQGVEYLRYNKAFPKSSGAKPASKNVTVKAVDEAGNTRKITLSKDQAQNIHNVGMKQGQKAAQEMFEKSPEAEGLKLYSNYGEGKTRLLSNRKKDNQIQIEDVEEPTTAVTEHNETYNALNELYKDKSKWHDWNIYKGQHERINNLESQTNFKQRIQNYFDPLKEYKAKKAAEKSSENQTTTQETPETTQETPQNPIKNNPQETSENSQKPTENNAQETSETPQKPTENPQETQEIKPKKTFKDQQQPTKYPEKGFGSKKYMLSQVNSRINNLDTKGKLFSETQEGKELLELRTLIQRSSPNEARIRELYNKLKLNSAQETKKSVIESQKEAAQEMTKKGRLGLVLQYHKEGGIIKAQAGTILRSGVRLNSNSGSWLSQIFNSYRQHILQNLHARGDDDSFGNWLNTMQHNHSLLYGAANAFGNWKDTAYRPTNKSVEEYQLQYDNRNDDITGSWKGYNNTGILNGYKNGRYNITWNKKHRTSQDWPNNNWKADNLYSSITDDRRLLGRKGDWDENSDDFKNWQSDLNKEGWETYLDTSDNYYKLRRLQKPTNPKSTGNPGNLNPAKPQEKQPNPLLNTVKSALSNPNILGLGRLVGDIQSTNRKTEEYLQHYKPTLIQPYNIHRQVYGDYGRQAYYENLGKQAIARAGQNLVSDASINAAKLREAQNDAYNLNIKGTLANNQKIAETSEESAKDAAINTQTNNTVANTNMGAMNQVERERAGLEAYRQATNQQNRDNFLMDLEKEQKTKQYEKENMLQQLQSEDLQRKSTHDYYTDITWHNYMNQITKLQNSGKSEAANALLKEAAAYKKNIEDQNQRNYLNGIAKLQGIDYNIRTPYQFSSYSLPSQRLGGLLNIIKSKKGTDTGIFLSTVAKTKEKDNDRLIKQILTLIKENNQIYKGMKQSKFNKIKI